MDAGIVPLRGLLPRSRRSSQLKEPNTDGTVPVRSLARSSLRIDTAKSTPHTHMSLCTQVAVEGATRGQARFGSYNKGRASRVTRHGRKAATYKLEVA